MQPLPHPHAPHSVFAFDGEFGAQYLSAPETNAQNDVQHNPYLESFEIPAETPLNLPVDSLLPPHLRTFDMTWQPPNATSQSYLPQTAPHTYSTHAPSTNTPYQNNHLMNTFAYDAPSIVASEWVPAQEFSVHDRTLQDTTWASFHPSPPSMNSLSSTAFTSHFPSDSNLELLETHQVPTRHSEAPRPPPIPHDNSTFLAQPSTIHPALQESISWLSEHDGTMNVSEAPPPAMIVAPSPIPMEHDGTKNLSKAPLPAMGAAPSSIPVVSTSSSLSFALGGSLCSSTTSGTGRDMGQPDIPYPNVPIVSSFHPPTTPRRHPSHTVPPNTDSHTWSSEGTSTSTTGIGSAHSVTLNPVLPPAPIIPAVRPAPSRPLSSDYPSCPTSSNAANLRNGVPSSSTIPSPKRFHPDTSPLTTSPTPSELLTSKGNEVQAKVGMDEPVEIAKLAQMDKPIETTNKKYRSILLSDTIGFLPTDSQTITSHNKKRNYLECLEKYIVYLEDEMRIVKLQPPAISKMHQHEMNNHSLRTLLVFQEKKLSELHQDVLKEEEKFMNLTKEIIALEEDNIRNGRDRSIAWTGPRPTESV